MKPKKRAQETITLSASEKILFIDFGYFLNFRKNATLAYLKHAHKSEDEFHTYFSKHVAKNIAEIVKKMKIPRSQMVLCYDSPIDEIWRREIYPLYKANRINTNACTSKDPESINLKETLMNIFKEEEIQIIKVPTLEADDIIAISIKKIKNVEKDPKIVIMSSDHDFLQLKGVEVVNAKLKVVQEKDFDLLKKILSGDKVDNIPPVYKRCGLKTAASLQNLSKEDLDQHLKSKSCEDNFRMNQLLIDMDEIPKKIVDLFDLYYKIKLT